MFIIPVMYLRGGLVLKPAGSAAASLKSDPLSLAGDWMKAGAELIHIIDLDTPPSGPAPNLEIIKKIISLGLQCQLEGNIRSADTVEKYFQTGIKRVILGAIAYQKPQFLQDLCQKFPDKISVHIDVRRGKVQIKGWTVATNKTALDYVEQFKSAGVTSVFYSDFEEEGTLNITDTTRIKEFIKKARLPVFFSEDVSNLNSIEQLLTLETYGLVGALLSKSIYDGQNNLEAVITFSKERSLTGMDEPTFTEER